MTIPDLPVHGELEQPAFYNQLAAAHGDPLTTAPASEHEEAFARGTARLRDIAAGPSPRPDGDR